MTRYGKVDSTSRKDYEAYFKNGVFEIKGAQVVAFLSTILPACPPMDDPMLGKEAAPAPAATTATPAPAAQPAPAAKPAAAMPEPAPAR